MGIMTRMEYAERFIHHKGLVPILRQAGDQRRHRGTVAERDIGAREVRRLAVAAAKDDPD